jgi:hypothetical protein
MQRLLARGVAIFMVALLAFLTLGVALKDGISPLVIVSFVVLAVVGIGVLGALGSSDD